MFKEQSSAKADINYTMGYNRNMKELDLDLNFERLGFKL